MSIIEAHPPTFAYKPFLALACVDVPLSPWRDWRGAVLVLDDMVDYTVTLAFGMDLW